MVRLGYTVEPVPVPKKETKKQAAPQNQTKKAVKANADKKDHG